MQHLNNLHVQLHSQNLKHHLDDPEIFCSCADAYRMGHEALKDG